MQVNPGFKVFSKRKTKLEKIEERQVHFEKNIVFSLKVVQ
jgi:hypothetical protein